MLDAFATKLFEQGGAWIVTAVLLMLLVVALYGIKRLFDELMKAQDAHAEDMREVAGKAVAAIELCKVQSEATTRAVEANGRVSDAHQASMVALRDSMDTLSRSITDVLIRRRT